MAVWRVLISAFTTFSSISSRHRRSEGGQHSDRYLSAFVKAAARDIKAYLKGVGSKALVGYSAVDGDAAFRNTLAEYMTCGDDTVRVDIYGEFSSQLRTPLRPLDPTADGGRIEQLRMVRERERQLVQLERHHPGVLKYPCCDLHVRVRVHHQPA
jgi:hypothetical protein